MEWFKNDTIQLIAFTIALVAIIAFLILWIKTRSENKNQQQLFNLQLKQKDDELRILSQNTTTLQMELAKERQQNLNLNIEMSELKTRLEENKKLADEKQRILIESEKRLNEQFENLANRIFDQSGKKLEQQNRQSLDHLLTPLKDQLEGFKKQVQDSFGQEAKERHTLAFEIRSLQKLNEQMTKEAVNLTNALKGNNKTQGNWGEVILNRILENSGLREGYEYELQVSLSNEENQRFQPDVIVHLPQGNDVIIDSKVTLIAYERYFNSEDADEKDQAMSEHLIAIRNHIKQLSQKNYHKLSGIKSLDYVLMFIPVEPAFLSAIDRDPALVNDALKNNIMLVSPTTLHVALRTINNLWRYEYQNRHAELIADKASKLYDKVRGFVEDMESLGGSLDKAQQTYQASMNKLSKGRGNIVGQVEQFREMGIEVKKPIKNEISESAIESFNDEV
ncbi:DNA recombination protein RmuC [Orbaceae bacterium ac157xtp]